MQLGAEEEVDYKETADVTKVHGAIKREYKDPEAAAVPVPMWLVVLVIVFTFGGAFYLGQFNGGFSGDVYNESEGAAASSGPAADSAAGAGAVVVETLAQQGKKVFAQNCASCHQPSGKGVAGVYPPMVNAEWVIGSPKRLTMILLKGVQGPMTVLGNTYNGAMPAWGGNLTDKKIAAVLSYIRSEWGNSAPEITPEQVAIVRKEFATRTEPWAEADLLAIPADAPIELAPAPVAN